MTRDHVTVNHQEQVYCDHTCCKGTKWLHSLISEVFKPINEPSTLFSDNQSTITLTQDHQYHTWSKHIDIQYHFIHWMVKNGTLHLVYCLTDDMVADMLTKALP